MPGLDAVFTESTTAMDPVCGMEVDVANPSGGSHEHEGTAYYFCAPGCRLAFARDPAHFLAHPGGHGHDGAHTH